MSDLRDLAKKIADGIVLAGFYINWDPYLTDEGVVDAIEKILEADK